MKELMQKIKSIIPMNGGTLKITSSIFISFIGSGVLGLPYAFKRSGVIEGALIMTFVAIFSTKAMLRLIDCKNKILNFSQESSINKKTVISNLENNTCKSTSVENNKGFAEIFAERTIHNDITHDSIRQRDQHQDKYNNNSSLQVEDNELVDLELNEPMIESNNSTESSEFNSITTPEITYGDVAFTAWGDFGRFVVNVSLMCAQLSFCCGYLIFIIENLSMYVISVDFSSFLGFLLVPLYLMTLIPDLERLTSITLIAQISNLFAFLVVFWFDFDHLHLASISDRTEVSLKGFPFFFCAAVYCFEGAGMILTLQQAVPYSLQSKFKQYFVKTIVCITTLYITFGASGYLSFGPETRDIITLNLSSDESTTFIDFAALVKMFLCISLFFSYPIMLFPVTRMLQRKCSGLNNQQSPIKTLQSTLKPLPMLIRFMLVTLSGLIVCLVPNFSTLMNIIGAVFGTLLAFIMPGLCHYAIFRNNITRSDVMMDYMLVIIGCLGCVLGVIEALYGETPDNSESITIGHVNSNYNHVSPVIQTSNANGKFSDNLLSDNSLSDHNVIKPDSNIGEVISKSISMAASVVSDNISLAITEISSTNKPEVISNIS